MARDARLFKAIQKVNEKAKFANEQPGTVGKPNGTIAITGKPHLIWVTTSRGNTIKAINLGVPATLGFPVIVEKDRDNNWIAKSPDGQRAAEFVGDAASGVGSAPHSHRIGFGNEDLVEELRFEPGLVHPTDPESLSVYIEPFFYEYNDTQTFFAGGIIDLTSNRPATANTWAWVKVGINPTTNLPTATTGTEQLKSVPLTGSQLAAVSFAGKIALAGVKLRNAQSQISNYNDFKSSRSWFAKSTFVSGAYLLLQPTANVVINEAGSDIDIRIEGDNDANLFTLDAGLDLIAIGGAVVAGIKAAIYGVFGVKAGGASATFARVGGRLNVNTTAVGNVGTGEDNLITYSIPAATVNTNGDTIKWRGAGTFANSVNTKRLRAYLGASLLFDTGVLAITLASDWSIEGEIIRTGATTQKAVTTLRSSDTGVTVAIDYTTPGETLANALTLKLTGEATADNDIVQELLVIDWIPNA